MSTGISKLKKSIVNGRISAMSKQIINALPELVKEGLLSEDSSQKIRAYYREKERHRPQRMNLVFGIIGAILVGLGIILIVAHNWDEMNRPLKVALSFAPLLVGQVLCGYSLLRKPGNQTWKESSSTFLFFAVGASIALVAQVYNIPGNTGTFLFTWMLLCFPLIYIMPSSIASLLYLAGITAYAVEDGYGYRAVEAHHYWWLLLLALPHYLLLILKKPAGNFTFFHHWAVPISLTICLGTLSGPQEEYMTLAYMSLFAVFYLADSCGLFFSERHAPINGYLLIGSLGTMILLIAASFRDFWTGFSDGLTGFSPGMLLGILVPALTAVALLFVYLKINSGKKINPLVFIFLVFAGVFFIGIGAPALGAILMNLLVLAVGIFIIRRGLEMSHLGILNYGLLIITVLVLCRFFDTDLSFVLRGLMFVAVGAGFFFANSLLMKKKKQYEQ
jgi:uncharacterized membrane protein